MCAVILFYFTLSVQKAISVVLKGNNNNKNNEILLILHAKALFFLFSCNK